MNPAFAYVYDDLLSDRKSERTLAELENVLAHRGIEGRIARLAMFRSPREMINEMLRSGARNVVFVGNDQTVLSLMSFLPVLDATFGYISVDPSSALASVLDMPVGVEAVDVLAARFVEACDVGQCGDRFFLMDVQIPGGELFLEVDQSFRIHTDAASSGVTIENLGSSLRSIETPSLMRGDGMLDVQIHTKSAQSWFLSRLKRPASEQTHLHAKHLSVHAKRSRTYRVDQQPCEGADMTFSVWPGRMRWITRRRKEHLCV